MNLVSSGLRLGPPPIGGYPVGPMLDRGTGGVVGVLATVCATAVEIMCLRSLSGRNPRI
jgi:hypothetical protein